MIRPFFYLAQLKFARRWGARAGPKPKIVKEGGQPGALLEAGAGKNWIAIWRKSLLGAKAFTARGVWSIFERQNVFRLVDARASEPLRRLSVARILLTSWAAGPPQNWRFGVFFATVAKKQWENKAFCPPRVTYLVSRIASVRPHQFVSHACDLLTEGSNSIVGS